ncbi:MAG: T9SS type A sorting domain-containing protein, partial [bacterium]
PAFHIFTDSRVLFTRSTDGGSTFLAPMAIDSVNLHSQEGPAIATDASGNPHIVWVGERIPPTLVDIYYSRSTDGGETFSPAIAVDSSFLEQREPSITVDSDGNLFVAYTQGPMLDHTEIYVAKSKDGGFSFTQKRLAEPFSSLCSLPVIKASSQPAVTNETMLVWSDYRSGPCKNVYFTKSTDGGMTFQYPIAVDSGDYEQVSSGLAVDSQGCPAVAWREWDMGFSWAFVAYSDDQGNTFSAPQRVDEYLDASMDEPRICFSKEGDLLVTWEDVRPTTGLRVRFARGVRTGIAERVHGKGGAPLTVETYPNPSSGEIFVRCGTGSDSNLSVAIYDVAGRVADVPVHGPHVIADGQSLFVIESSRGYLEAGVYFVVVRCSREQKEVRGIQKVVVLR